MPVYVYHCEQCNFEFEQQQKYSDKSLRICPECGHESLQKVYTPVGVIFKGSGFYSTDNRSSSNSNFPSKAKKEEKSDNAEGNKKEPEKTATAKEKTES